MPIGSTVVSAFFLLCVAANVASAKDNKFPTINLQERCKVSARATQEMLIESSPDTLASCMKSEQEARDAIAKIWKEIPSSYKAFCIEPNVYSPSYVEWIACLELHIDVKKMRANKSAQPEYPSTTCPVVKYLDDGSVQTVKACSLIAGG